MAALLEPEQIIHDLNDLWNALEKQGDSGGVLRACSMTLIVAAEDQADAEESRRTLGVLMHDHPSRAVVLHMRDGSEVDARVFAECWRPFGSAQQICSEGVEITAGPRRFDEVAQLLVPLRVPDLPVVLWCRGPSAFSLRAFDALFPLADKIIFDSSAVPAAGAALGFLRRLRARGYRVSDLDWTRLTGWREILAHLFDNHALRPSGVSSARVIYGGSEASASALYFASWIGNALPDARVRLEAARESEPGLRSVVLIGSKEEIALTKTGGSCIDVKGSGRDYRSPLPPVDEQALMREELKIIGPDPVFERVLG